MKEETINNPKKKRNSKPKTSIFENCEVSCVTVYSRSLSHAIRIHTCGSHIYMRRVTFWTKLESNASLLAGNYVNKIKVWNLNPIGR